MIKKLLLITGVLHSTYAWTDVRTDDETIQLECEETYWFQIDLVRNEHLAWKYDEPKTPLILKSIEIKPTEIKFVVNNEDALINRNTGQVAIKKCTSCALQTYQCKRITIEESAEAREIRLQDIESSRLF
tara:strand:+ start:111 stop:500 length:390 start_codon:yes stop_codon:yes gene_type:complete